MKKIVNIILASALLVSSTTSCSDFYRKIPLLHLHSLFLAEKE